MALNKYRSTGDKYYGPVAEQMKELDPNTLTWWSVFFAFMAGGAFMFADRWVVDVEGYTLFPLLFFAAACVFLNGSLDLLDGKVARMTGRESPRGDFLDHVLDRISDVLILGGIMLSPFCDNFLGALAIIVTLLVSYMGTQAQAVGCGRNYGGIMGRADRIVVLTIIPLLQLVWNLENPDGIVMYVNMTLIKLMIILFIITGIFTVVHRGLESWRELGGMEGEGK